MGIFLTSPLLTLSSYATDQRVVAQPKRLLTLKVSKTIPVELFQQSIDTHLLETIVKLQPIYLKKFIEDRGVDIKKIKTTGDIRRVLNPVLGNVPVATEAELAAIGWQKDYEARFIKARNPCCKLKRDTIFIREDAKSYSLIREFLYSQIRNSGGEVSEEIEQLYNRASRVHDFRLRKIIENPINLLNPLWRRDIVNAQEEVISLVANRIKVTQAQEAIIELSLYQYIKPGNIYFDFKRQKEGIRYTEAMINNAITVFNNIYFSLDWTKNTITDIYQAIKNEDLIVREAEKISDEEYQIFIARNQLMLDSLEPIKNEIIKMKQIYTQITGRK